MPTKNETELLGLDLVRAIREGLAKAIDAKLSGYNSPLDKIIADVIKLNVVEIRKLLLDGIGSALKDQDFRQQIQQVVRQKMARQLIEKFGGELEKQVNLLKSDPATRARITVAIEDIVKGAK
jgi:hypothetical protein